ncbi:MAG: transposase [Planctomycetaceae bacterium]
MGSVDAGHNAYGSPFLEPDVERRTRAAKAMTQPPYTMDARRREVVCDAIVELAEERGWRLWAVHVRSNHVHVIIGADREPGRLMSDLKARASRNLTRCGLDDAKRKRWTRHGSTKHLFRMDDVEAKIDYVLEQQGAPMARFDGREPREPRTE